MYRGRKGFKEVELNGSKLGLNNGSKGVYSGLRGSEGV